MAKQDGGHGVYVDGIFIARSVPEEALDSPEQMQPWAKLAVAAALRKPAAIKAARKNSRKRGA